MADTPELRLYNTLTREKAPFQPIDPSHVRMYVCGPTVYDFAHIGNARPVIVFDVLYRLLKHLAGKGAWDGGKGQTKVTYARNITDVDDKINARALRDYPGMELNAAIRLVTEKTETQFHEDVKALGCLPPDVEPRATDNITQMIDIIQKLLDRGHAYVAAGADGREVLFSTGSMADYGQLSKRKLEDQQAGARVAVEAHKRNPADFVLWKHSDADQPGWPARFTVDGADVDIYGRPGWHIECSAMSGRYLGDVFDIHGGGLDLIFPHHENEIAQSRCAHGTHAMANVWMHNGFLQVEGKKMSKSEGNFFTIHQILHTNDFGGRRWAGPVLRLAMLYNHYRDPIDWTQRALWDARRDMNLFAEALTSLRNWFHEHLELPSKGAQEIVDQYLADNKVQIDTAVLNALADDLNTSMAVTRLKVLSKTAATDHETALVLLNTLQTFGVLKFDQLEFFGDEYLFDPGITDNNVVASFSAAAENYRVDCANNAVAASVCDYLSESARNAGVKVVEVRPCLLSFNLESPEASQRRIEEIVNMRLELLKAKNFAEADKIRDELLAKGIQLKDGKDPVTGERVTTWELKR